MQVVASHALLRPGVEQRIEKFPVFEDVVLEPSFQGEAGFLQHACGSGIVRKHFRRDAVTASVMMPRPQKSSPSQYSPRSLSMHILARVNADSANCGTVNLDGKNCPPTAQLSSFARIHARHRLCTDTERDRAARAKRFGCSRASRVSRRHPVAMGEWCSFSERDASTTWNRI